jgi:hypothetical protein
VNYVQLIKSEWKRFQIIEQLVHEKDDKFRRITCDIILMACNWWMVMFSRCKW